MPWVRPSILKEKKRKRATHGVPNAQSRRVFQGRGVDKARICREALEVSEAVGTEGVTPAGLWEQKPGGRGLRRSEQRKEREGCFFQRFWGGGSGGQDSWQSERAAGLRKVERREGVGP